MHLSSPQEVIIRYNVTVNYLDCEGASHPGEMQTCSESPNYADYAS